MSPKRRRATRLANILEPRGYEGVLGPPPRHRQDLPPDDPRRITAEDVEYLGQKRATRHYGTDRHAVHGLSSLDPELCRICLWLHSLFRRIHSGGVTSSWGREYRPPWPSQEELREPERDLDAHTLLVRAMASVEVPEQRHALDSICLADQPIAAISDGSGTKAARVRRLVEAGLVAVRDWLRAGKPRKISLDTSDRMR